MPETDEQRAMAAVLDAGCGAVASNESAAALWGLPGFDLGSLELSRPRSGPNRPTVLAEVHHPLLLPADQCTVRKRIPVTTLACTVFDLAGSVHAARAERALHAALRLGLSWPTVLAHLAELGEHGRPGIALMRRLVADHVHKPALGSGLEARVLRLLKRAGLPEPRRQVDLGGRAWAGRVDFLYDDVRLVVEVNGNWHHASVLDVERDQRRTAALVAA